jgi:outer membrane protein assembly factor BamB
VIAGRGFGSKEAVDILWDAETLNRIRTSSVGSFRVRITVPLSAGPGDHLISAVGESSGSSAQQSFAVHTDWTKFHFDLESTGNNRFENVVSPANVANLDIKWAASFGHAGISSPAIAGGKIFVGAPGPGLAEADIWAMDGSTGDVIWEQTTEGLVTSAPTVWGGDVFVGTLYDHTIRAYDATTGVLQWAFTGAGAMNSPVVAGGRLYVTANSGIVYALDPRTGSELWEATTGPGILARTVAVSSGVVFVGSESAVADPTFFAFDAITGATRWSAKLNQIASSAAVSNGVVYVGSEDHNLYALDSGTGATRWNATTGDGVDSSPAVANGVVYAGSLDGNLYAFDALTGAVRWKVFVGGDGGEPIVANGVVYVASGDDTVYGLEASSGDVLWSYRAGTFEEAGAIADGVLYMASFDGNLYSFSVPS